MGIYYKGEEVGFIVNSPATGTLEIIENGEYDVRDKAKVDVNVEEKTPMWEPNPTWWDIDKILEEDTRDYPTKAVFLLYANDTTTEEIFDYYGASAYATSDGAFYELDTAGSVTHNWDLTKDKPCLVNGGEQYKTRYVIVYSSDNVMRFSLADKTNILCATGYSSSGQYIPYGTSYLKNIRAIEGFIRWPLDYSTTTKQPDNWFSSCGRLQTIPHFNIGHFTKMTSAFNGCANLLNIPLLDVSNCTELRDMFRDCRSLQTIPLLDTSKNTDFSNMFNNCNSLQTIPQLTTSSGTSFSYMFSECRNLQTIPLLDTSSGTTFNYMFEYCSSLKTIPQLDTSNGTSFGSMFNGCRNLLTIPQLDTSKGTNFSYMVANCTSLQTVPLINTSKGTIFSNMFSSCYSLQTIPLLNTSNGTNFSSMFSSCYGLKTIPLLDTSSGTNFSSMFYTCNSLQAIPQLDTSKGTSFGNMFSGCQNLETIPLLDLISATSVSSMFNACYGLKNLTLKNIKISLQIGSAASFGRDLTVDSLLNTTKELWDNTSGTSTLTLTVGSVNLTKLSNVYVKLVDITDEMRAEDEYIDNKKPFAVCESTDEGAMLITEYITSKNWQLA